MENQAKQAALIIGADGGREYLLPLSIADMEQIVNLLQRDIMQAKQQARITPRVEQVQSEPEE